MLVFVPTLNSHPVWAQWSNVSKTTGWMCVDLELGINSGGGGPLNAAGANSQTIDSPRRECKRVFSYSTVRLTASGRHAESSSFIYSVYPTAFPSRSNCSLGWWQMKTDTKKTKKDRWELWNSKNNARYTVPFKVLKMPDFDVDYDIEHDIKGFYQLKACS